MKRFFLILALLVLLPWQAHAQSGGEGNPMVVNVCNPAVKDMNFNITCAPPAGGADPNLLTNNVMSSVIIGNKAGTGITAEGDSVFIGNYSGHSYAGGEGYYEHNNYSSGGNGTHNVAVGAYAMGGASPAGCALGHAAGGQNVAVGAYALQNGKCMNSNVAIGDHAGQFIYGTSVGDSLANFRNYGTQNVVIGGDTGQNIVDSSYNVAIGAQSMTDFTSNLGYTGKGNTAVGAFNAIHLQGAAAHNTIIGGFVARTTLKTGSYNILIGTSETVDTPAPNTSNFLNIGNAIYGHHIDTENPMIAIGTSVLDPGITFQVNGMAEDMGSSHVASNFSKASSASLSAIPGLSATLVGSVNYGFEIYLMTTSSAGGGIQVDLGGGTISLDSLAAEGVLLNNVAIAAQTRATALTSVVCSSAGVTAGTCDIKGFPIAGRGGGSFIPRFAQNTSNAAASVVLVGSWMKVWPTH